MSELSVTWGRSFTYQGTLTLDGTPLPVTGSGMAFTTRFSAGDGEPFFVKTVGDGIVVVDDEDGTFQVHLDGTETSALPPGVDTVLLFDLTAWELTPDEPLDSGTLLVRADVGRAG